METIFLAIGWLVLLGTAAALTARRARRHRARLEGWREAASREGLTDVVVRNDFFVPSLRGRAGALTVTLMRTPNDRRGTGTHIVVGGLGQLGGWLSLRCEEAVTALERRLGGRREILVGDPGFDDGFFIEGDLPLALAVLGAVTRERLAKLTWAYFTSEREWGGLRVSLTDGELQVQVAVRQLPPRGNLLSEVLTASLEIARTLVAPLEIPRRIADNFRGEPEAEVRLQQVLALACESPQDPVTRETLLLACRDVAQEVRLQAGLALGREGEGTLRALVSGVDVQDSVAARAIEALGGRLADQLEESLRIALTAGRGKTACACLTVMGKRARPEDEPLMLEALRVSGDPEVVGAAVLALGRAGTVAAVPPLLEASESRPELRSAARQAIAEIQSRIPGAGPGHLSLAGGEAGALSLAASQPGQLSLTDAPPQQPDAAMAAEPSEEAHSSAPTPHPRALE